MMRFTHFVAAGALLTACSSTSAQPAKRQTATDVVATVGPTSITLAQVDDKALEQSASSFGSMKLSHALYEARRNAIEELIAITLIDQEAKARGMERSALVEQEITSKIPAVADQDVTAWYQANQGRVQGASLDQVRQPIRAFLLQERMQAARQQYIETLKTKTPVRVMLEPPRQNVSAAKGAAKGPANAPIQIIEFSDFQCPYCQRANPAIEQVLKTYGDRIHFVYRHFPLANHPNARPAAEASECAAEQGKLLAVSRQAVRQSGAAGSDRPETARGRPGTRWGEVQGLCGHTEIQEPGRSRRPGWRAGWRQRNAGFLHQRPHVERSTAV